MSKVLVDRELLGRACMRPGRESQAVNHQDIIDRGQAQAEIRAILAQPAEAEGVGNARLMSTLAELARRAPLRTLHTICETQHQVSTVKLERYLEPIGDTLAGYAFTLRIDFDKLSAALSAVTAERDRLQHALGVKEEFYQDALHSHIVLAQQRDLLLAALERTVDYHVPGINPLSDAANLSAMGVIERVKQPVITGESE